MGLIKKLFWLLAFLIIQTPAFSQGRIGGSLPTGDILDSIIGLLIILFILSMINEKITQLIRKYSPFIKPGTKLHGTKMSSFWRHIRKKQTDGTILDDKIEREVNSLSFVVGLLITLIFCVDLFRMVTVSDPRTVLYWDKEKWNFYWGKEWVYRIPILLVSFCLTGFFLTFGSKFFHDLLDTLFQVKNLKRKLSDERTFKDPQSIEELEDFIKTPESKLSTLAVEQRAAGILSIKNVIAVGSGYMQIGNERVGCLEIHVTDESVIPLLGKEYKIKLSSGLEVKVPSNIIVTGGYPKANAGASGNIANATRVLGFGTLGGIVEDIITKQKYILSCHHVLNGEINWKGLSQTRDIILEENGQENIVAELSFGFRTNEMDTALAKLLPNANLSNNTIGNPKAIRKVENIDAINQVSISLFGAKTGKRVEGRMFNNSWDTKFRYPKADGSEELWQLNDLIVLTGTETTTLTQPGDSGAFVLDKDNKVIGMVVGGDKKFTYAIKMDKIAETFNIQLI
jgi:hypothetical protein